MGIYKVSMEEARCGAVCPGNFVPVLTCEGKCSRLRAKLAHMVGHLPRTLAILNSFLLAVFDWLEVSNVARQMRVFATQPLLALRLLVSEFRENEIALALALSRYSPAPLFNGR
jgi:hypothetical protein